MAEYFPGIPRIPFEGPGARNPLAFRHYDPSEVVDGRTMEQHLRFAVCYWHTFKFAGSDPFGLPTMERRYNGSGDPVRVAEETMVAAFELFSKLGVKFWCFHDSDIAPEAATLSETNANLDRIVALASKLQDDTGIRPLWGTANLFSNPRFMAGAATNPSPHVFAWAAAKVKKAMEVSKELGAAGYVFWGGREGYETLLNTDMKRETENLARFLRMAADYRREIGFDVPLYIEPKPKEPAKHQYDFDAATCHAFLQRHGLLGDFRLNIEVNHATLAGHDMLHELEYAFANDIFGSIDANRGDLLLGWDTDQFPSDVPLAALTMYSVLRGGGFTAGGLNFDARLRRQSVDPADLFHAHIGSMDAFARGLKIAARLRRDGILGGIVRERYAEWEGELGRRIESGACGFAELEAHVLRTGEPALRSGRQEMIENILNDYIHS